MKSKITGIVLVIALLVGTIPMMAFADYSLPSVFGAPQNLSVHYYATDDTAGPFTGFTATITAPAELRSFLDQVAQADSSYNAAGYYLSDLELQLDYKIDNGNWQYTSDWDNRLDWMQNMSSIRLASGTYSASSSFTKDQLDGFAPGVFPETNAYFDTHTMTFRARLIVSSTDSNGNNYRYASAWSSDYKFSNKQTAAIDPAKLINHAPVLKSAEIRKYENGSPYLHITTDPANADLNTLFSASNGNVTTELWLKAGDGPWVCPGLGGFDEQFDTMDLVAYFGQKDSYDAVVFQVKLRYAFNLYYMPGSTSSETIYSPYSNILSKGMPAYTGASTWAVSYLDKAAQLGLITDRLKTLKMSDPITREEFAEVAVKFYEKVTGQSAVPVAQNPFKDCTNPEVLKAYNLKITAGTGDGTTFEPNAKLLRQQMAVMITNTLRACYQGFAMDIAGQADFKDQKSFAAYSIKSAKFMAKYKITAGDGKGNFVPNNNCTRQEAITFLVKALENKDKY